MATVTATGSGSPIQVPGLAAGNWKFNVAAVNSAGTSAQSTTSAAVAIVAPQQTTTTLKHSAWTGSVSYENTFLQTITGQTTDKSRWWGRNYLPHDITQIDNPSGSYSGWKSAGYTGMILGTPLAGPSMSCAQVAAGNADTHVANMAKRFDADWPNGTGAAIVGWETNIAGEYPWCFASAGQPGPTPAEFKAAFKRVAGIIHANSKLLVDWTISGGSGQVPSAGVPDPSDLDVYGTDDYDAYRGSGTPQQRWATTVGGPTGLLAIINQAKSTGKKWSVPEWGVSPANQNGGGDDPYYISNMLATMKTGNDLAGLIKTDYPAAYHSYYSASWDLLGGNYPNSLAAYKAGY